MKLSHELFLLLHAVGALDDARLAVRLALAERSADRKARLIQWARDEVKRYAPRLRMWWEQTQQLAAASEQAQAFSGREALEGKAAGLSGSGHLSRLPGIRVKARRFFPRLSSRLRKMGTAGASNAAAKCSSSGFISNCLPVSNAGGAL